MGLEMRLQFFAEEPGEDDDFSEVDEVEETDEETDEDVDIEDIDLGKIFDDDEETDEETEEETEETEEESEQEESEEKPEEQVKQPVTFTPEQQEYVNSIVQDRLSRDRKTTQIRELERISGLSIDQIVEYARQNQVSDFAEKRGIPEEEARRLIQQEEELNRYREQEEYLQQERENTHRVMSYIMTKQRYANDPYVRKYEKEIDAFAQNGIALDFEPAMNYILGEKIRSGELLQAIQNGTEKKTLANTAKRSKVAPVKGSVGGKTNDVTLSAAEKRVAASLGLSPKEYAAEKARMNKR